MSVDLSRSPMVFVEPKFLSRLFAGLRSFFYGVKESEVSLLSVGPNVGAPFLRGLVKVNTGDSATVSRGSLHVAPVHRSWNIAQIAPSVVRSDAINMIDLAGGVFPGHPLPDNAVRKVSLLIDPDSDVAFHGHEVHDLPSPGRVPSFAGRFGGVFSGGFKLAWRSFAPRQLSSLWAVTKYLAQKFGVWHLKHSLDDLLNRSFRLAGVSVSALASASLFYIECKEPVYVG